MRLFQMNNITTINLPSIWIKCENLANPLKQTGKRSFPFLSPSVPQSFKILKYDRVTECKMSAWFFAKSNLSTTASPSFSSFSISAMSFSCWDFFNRLFFTLVAILAVWIDECDWVPYTTWDWDDRLHNKKTRDMTSSWPSLSYLPLPRLRELSKEVTSNYHSSEAKSSNQPASEKNSYTRHW